MRYIAFLILVVSSAQAHAFSEMVRHGYQNCTACHVNPGGGGVLNEYGRSLSSELLSTWSYKNEEQFGHGLIKKEMPKWLAMGGDLRWLRQRQHVDGVTDGSSFLMEEDLGAAVKIDKVTMVGYVGKLGSPDADDPDKGDFISKEHYVMYNITDVAYVRAGKFEPPFGIFQPNHTAITRGGLGFADGTQTYNVEAGYIGEKYNAILTVDFGRFDQGDNVNDGNGFGLNLADNIGETYKVGLSIFRRTDINDRRTIAGPYGILGFTKQWVLLTEEYIESFDAVNGSPSESGLVAYNRLQYEIHKGINVYVESDFRNLTQDSKTHERNQRFVGLLFYPRPHLEILGEIGQTRSITEGKANQNPYYGDAGWIQGHYYF